MKTHSPSHRGFTLVEAIIYMALLSVLLVALTDMFVSILNVKSESDAVSATVIDSRFVFARLRYDISRASSIITPAALGGSSTSLTAVVNGATTTFAVQEGRLMRTDAQGSESLTGPDTIISSSTFRRLGNAGGKDTVKIYMTIESVTARDSGYKIKILETTIGRR
jgi:type II secretory pathway component PulJ